MPKMPGFSSRCIACMDCHLLLTLSLAGESDVSPKDLEPGLEDAAAILGWRRDVSREHQPICCSTCARKRRLGCARCLCETCACIGGPRFDARPM